jgi:CheY-like chemotaxis protein
MSAPIAPHRCRVLLAEDNPDQRAILRIHLRGRPFSVDFANTGELTLALWHISQDAGAPYELIVTDIAMPMKTGVAVLEELKAEGATVPVILVTAMAKEDVAAQLRAASGLQPLAILYKPDAYVNIVPYIIKALEEQGCDMTWASEDGDMRMPEELAAHAFTSPHLRSVGRATAAV